MKTILAACMAVMLAIAPGNIHAQDAEGDLKACEILLDEAVVQMEDLERQVMEAMARESECAAAYEALENKKNEGPFVTPMRGALQGIPVYQKQKPYVQIGIAGLIDLLFLVGAAYLEIQQ